MTAVTADAAALGADLVELRRRLHRIPEIGLDLPETRAAVLHALDGLGLEVTTYPGCSGVAAVVHGTEPGPVVLLRADMDALPIAEETASISRSTDRACTRAVTTCTWPCWSVRHACSPARRASLRGSVVFMFQPGEEGYFGARHMIDAGVLTAAGRPADAAYALHVAPALIRRGVVANAAGTVAGVRRPPPRRGPRRIRARRPSASSARSGPGRGGDRHRVAHRGDASSSTSSIRLSCPSACSRREQRTTSSRGRPGSTQRCVRSRRDA